MNFFSVVESIAVDVQRHIHHESNGITLVAEGALPGMVQNINDASFHRFGELGGNGPLAEKYKAVIKQVGKYQNYLNDGKKQEADVSAYKAIELFGAAYAADAKAQFDERTQGANVALGSTIALFAGGAALLTNPVFLVGLAMALGGVATFFAGQQAIVSYRESRWTRRVEAQQDLWLKEDAHTASRMA